MRSLARSRPKRIAVWTRKQPKHLQRPRSLSKKRDRGLQRLRRGKSSAHSTINSKIRSKIMKNSSNESEKLRLLPRMRLQSSGGALRRGSGRWPNRTSLVFQRRRKQSSWHDLSPSTSGSVSPSKTRREGSTARCSRGFKSESKSCKRRGR